MGGEDIRTVDIRRFIVVPPEVDFSDVQRAASERGLQVGDPLKGQNGLYTLEKIGVPVKDFPAAMAEINAIKNALKEAQISGLDQAIPTVKLDSKIVVLVSSFLAEARRHSTIDEKQAMLLLQSVLGNLFSREIDGVPILDDDVIERLARAAVAKAARDVEANLTQAMVRMLIQIRKLSLLLLYETVSLTLLNLGTAKVGNLGKTVKALGDEYDLIPINIDDKRYYVGYAHAEMSLITFNMGRKTQDALIPVLYNLVISRASLRWKIVYTDIVLEAVARLQEEAMHQLHSLPLGFQDVSADQLRSGAQAIDASFNLLYRMLLNFRNANVAENRSIRRFYTGVYSRNMGRYLGGAISNAVRSMSPLGLLDKLDEQERHVAESVRQVSSLRVQVLAAINEMATAKESSKLSSFRKARKRLTDAIKDYSSDVIAKLLAELFKGKNL